MGGSGLDRTDDFKKNFGNQDWIGFNFFGSGLELDWQISQSAHLWFLPLSILGFLYVPQPIMCTNIWNTTSWNNTDPLRLEECCSRAGEAMW